MGKIGLYKDYPSPKSIDDAIQAIENGNEIWVEYLDCPEHGYAIVITVTRLGLAIY